MCRATDEQAICKQCAAARLGGVGCSASPADLDRQEVIAEIGRCALSGVAFEVLAQGASRLCAGVFGAEYSSVLRLASGGDHLSVCAGVGWPDGVVGSAKVGVDQGSHAGYTLLADDTVVVDDYEREARFTPSSLVVTHGVRSSISAVIGGSERPFGVISVHATRPFFFKHDDAHFLRAVANTLGAAYEPRRSEEAVRESERHYRELFERAHDPIIIFEPEGERVFDVNRMACEVYGFERDEFIGMSLETLTLDVARGRARIAETISAGSYHNFETRHFTRDGRELLIEVNASVINYKGRRAILSLNRDVTERRRVERALVESEARFRRMAESGIIGIIHCDPAGRILEANDYFLKAVGRARGELEEGALCLRDLTPPEFHVLDEIAAESLARDGFYAAYEKEYVRGDGSRVRVVQGGAMLEGAGGRVVIFVLDDTRRRQAEESLRASESQLLHAQKMESVGRLAGGVAHDFNNLLAVITLQADLMGRELDPGGRPARRAEEIKKSAERAATLTRQLLAFSRKQVLQPTVTDLNEVLAGVGKILRSLLGEEVELLHELNPAPGKVLADRGQLEQVILNLAVNARDAMKRQGRLTVGTRNVRLDREEAERVGAKEGAYVLLSVADTGAGMSEEVRARAFEPFFTTKDIGEGTGLGLSTVYGIVKQSGGHITLESTPGQGTTVRVYLPRVDEAGADDAGREHGGETILLVEDEPMVMRMMQEILETAGYRLLTAGGGEEAVRTLAVAAEKVDLLLTDVVMPGMDGRELARRLLSLRPDLKVLYMSGYANPSAFGGVGGHALLPKPFYPQGLLSKIRAVLDGRAQ